MFIGLSPCHYHWAIYTLYIMLCYGRKVNILSILLQTCMGMGMGMGSWRMKLSISPREKTSVTYKQQRAEAYEAMVYKVSNGHLMKAFDLRKLGPVNVNDIMTWVKIGRCYIAITMNMRDLTRNRLTSLNIFCSGPLRLSAKSMWPINQTTSFETTSLSSVHIFILIWSSLTWIWHSHFYMLVIE